MKPNIDPQDKSESEVVIIEPVVEVEEKEESAVITMARVGYTLGTMFVAAVLWNVAVGVTSQVLAEKMLDIRTARQEKKLLAPAITPVSEILGDPLA